MQGLNQQTSDGIPFNQTVIRRAGPHLDLAGSCSYLDDEFLNKPLNPHSAKQLLQLSNLVKKMLSASEKEERLATARDILNIERQCGLALVVLAREGAATEAEADSFYRRAIESLCAEREARKRPTAESKTDIDFSFTREPVGSFLVSADLVVAVTLEFARRLKLRGEMGEAIALLNRATDLTSEANAAMIELFAWHMCADQVAEARVLLDRRVDFHEHWSFMHAFATYKELGACDVSRSTMHNATQNHQATAHAMAGDDLTAVAKYLFTVWEPIPFSEITTFVEAMRPVLDAVPGLQQWLIDCACNSPSFANITQAASTRPDIRPAQQTTRNSYGKLKDYLDYAHSHVRRNETKEAKKYIKLALRECEKLPIGTWEIYSTMKFAILENLLGCKHVVQSMCVNNCDLAEKSNDLRLKARVFLEVGMVMSALKETELAVSFYAHAGDALERQHDSTPEFDSHYEMAAPLDQLATLMVLDKKYEGAEHLYLRIASLNRQFFPMHHPAVLAFIYLRSECMHLLGRHQDEGELIKVVQDLYPAHLCEERENISSYCSNHNIGSSAESLN